MFSLLKRASNPGARPNIFFRRMTSDASSGEEWQTLLLEIEALAKRINANRLAIAQETNDNEQIVALFTNDDLLAEDAQNLILTPEVLLIKKSLDIAWKRSSSQTELYLPKASLRNPSLRCWEVRSGNSLRRGQIFTQERHLLAAPFRVFL